MNRNFYTVYFILEDFEYFANVLFISEMLCLSTRTLPWMFVFLSFTTINNNNNNNDPLWLRSG